MLTDTLTKKLTQLGNEHLCPIAIMVRDGAMLTGLRNYTEDVWKSASVWTVPGGRCNPGETLEQTLRREVYEEVGISEFSIEDFIAEFPGAKEGDLVPTFYCITTQDAACREPEKFSEWRWVSLSEYIENKEYAGFNEVARTAIISYLQQVKTVSAK